MIRRALLPLLAAGSFGVHAADKEALLREWHAGFLPLPALEVRMHKFEVTQEVYRVVAGADPSQWKGERNSVEVVSWDEAVAFCVKATTLLREAKLIGAEDVVRLPAQREWEIACRAGTTTAFSFGDDAAMLGEFGWFAGNAAGNDPPAGAKKPNPWGLFDMHGYLWEWCADVSGESRVVRGGAWTSKAEECRSDSRRVITREHRGPDVGLRCVLAR
ncbi:MAG: formylglycine-generating enzyme family protein [Chthoniobacteraceae bacterium]